MSALLERAAQFTEGAKILTEWLGHGAVTVSPELAQARANVCLKCPQNVKKSFASELIADAIRVQVAMKKNLKLRVNGEKSLHICDGCGCVLRLKIHVPLKNILPDPEEMNKFQDKCWLKTEKQ